MVEKQQVGTHRQHGTCANSFLPPLLFPSPFALTQLSTPLPLLFPSSTLSPTSPTSPPPHQEFARSSRSTVDSNDSYESSRVARLVADRRSTSHSPNSKARGQRWPRALARVRSNRSTSTDKRPTRMRFTSTSTVRSCSPSLDHYRSLPPSPSLPPPLPQNQNISSTPTLWRSSASSTLVCVGQKRFARASSKLARLMSSFTSSNGTSRKSHGGNNRPRLPQEKRRSNTRRRRSWRLSLRPPPSSSRASLLPPPSPRFTRRRT